MQPSTNSIFIHSFSAFRRPSNDNVLANESLAELEAFIQQVIENKKKVEIRPIKEYEQIQTQIVKTMMDLLYSLQLELKKESSNQNGVSWLTTSTEIPMSLLRGICIMGQECLFETSCKYHCELALSMIFEKGLFETFRLCLFSDNESRNNSFTLEQLDSIISNLLQSDYRLRFLDNVYSLHGGCYSSIEKNTFEQKLKCIISNIGRVFTEKSNLITRNLKNVRKSRFINDIISHSIKTICNYKNEEFVNEEIKKISQFIFGNKAILTRDEFN